MYKSEIDLSVLIIFFARPSTLKETFEQVKKARPSMLFLACDGPRNEEEAKRVEECKKIVNDIDWECEVYRNYSEENKGCGRGPSEAISWAFGYTDKLLILEDDCVANPTLFPFIKENLDRYENDDRIGVISGFNHLKEWDVASDSYFYTKTGATLGWGTWKRVWENFDYNVSGIENARSEKLLRKELINKRVGAMRVHDWKKANLETHEKKVNYWDVQFGFVKYSMSYLTVVPKYNLIYNNGVGEGSTHTAKAKYKEWKKGQILFMPTKELEFPLKHPEHIICDRDYDEEVFKILYPKKWKRILRKIKRKILG